MYYFSESIILTFLAINAYTDLKKKRIYAVIIFMFLIIGVVFFILKSDRNFVSIFGGLGIGLIVLVISKVSNQAIGYGDGLIFLVTGVYLGFGRNIVLLLYGLILCGVISLVLLTLKKIKIKDKIPFVPFILIAFILMIIMGV